MADILEHLGQHGCKDITSQLDISKFSEYPISSGGFGDVYRGALRDGNFVAVKCLRLHVEPSETANKQLKHAARELYVWSKCNHPNVLGLIGVGQHRDQLAMISPWMGFGNVRRLLDVEPKTDRYALVCMVHRKVIVALIQSDKCLQIADGVAYLHSVGVVHGDLKGDNVLISDDFIPKLTDFGNATLRNYTLQFSTTTSRAATSLNWVVTEKAEQAPEMLDEDSTLTAEADVYSLGMTIFEVVSGSIPYAGMREPIIVTKIITGAHPKRPYEHIPSQVNHADLLWALLVSCWTRTPEDRPTSAEVRDKVRILSLGSKVAWLLIVTDGKDCSGKARRKLNVEAFKADGQLVALINGCVSNVVQE